MVAGFTGNVLLVASIDAAIQQWSKEKTPVRSTDHAHGPEILMPQKSVNKKPAVVSNDLMGYTPGSEQLDDEYELLGSETLESIDESLVSLLAE